ncbi:hypothetical protein V5P93_001848 [Actinokineospora auranticolor]|uniref:Glycerophosphoryl diester phosphodiesterase family protein n=1 Tax=Actinokineospora auranticolor TaxID=155976 RepID=A0A2S6GFF7_9PSEU|nr:hypothetical protein [Actinokineospora auranticolor]PPK63942.1 hypothetical protein CLV40_12362 [Actinokineospora auranticolor]
MSEQHEPMPEMAPQPATDHTGALRLGIVPLRPLKLGDILSGAWQALRLNAGALVGVSLLVTAASEVLTRLIAGASASSATQVVTSTAVDSTKVNWSGLWSLLGSFGLLIVIIGLFSVVISGVVNVVVPRAVFGHGTSASAALRGLRPSVGKLIGVSLLSWLVYLLIGAIAVFGIVATGQSGSLLVLPVFGIIAYLATAWSFAPSVAVVEGLGPAEALARSKSLVHAVGWWRVFGYMALVGAMTGLVLGALTALLATVTHDNGAVDAVVTILATTVITPFTQTVQTLLYVDHRARTEGIEGLWRVAG